MPTERPIVKALQVGPKSILDISKVYGFEVTCPKCGARLRIGEWSHRVLCLKCKHRFLLAISHNSGQDEIPKTIHRGRHDKESVSGVESDV